VGIVGPVAINLSKRALDKYYCFAKGKIEAIDLNQRD
jgi:hypothetical protein